MPANGGVRRERERRLPEGSSTHQVEEVEADQHAAEVARQLRQLLRAGVSGERAGGRCGGAHVLRAPLQRAQLASRLPQRLGLHHVARVVLQRVIRAPVRTTQAPSRVRSRNPLPPRARLRTRLAAGVFAFTQACVSSTNSFGALSVRTTCFTRGCTLRSHAASAASIDGPTSTMGAPISSEWSAMRSHAGGSRSRARRGPWRGRPR
jgi:hypothetical protein